MTRPRVSILSPDLGDNCLGRALVLADLLAERYAVRILGPLGGRPIWAPARSSGHGLVPIPFSGPRDYPATLRRLRAEIDGSRVVISKARMSSLGLARMAGVRASSSLLDIDDWEVALVRSRLAVRPWSAATPARVAYLAATAACERLARRPGPKTVASRWLLDRFGGELLYHVRDTDVLDPERQPPAAARRAHGLDDRIWIGFIGTIRPHKGIDDLITAVERLEHDPAPGLLLAGLDPADPFADDTRRRAERVLGGERLRVIEAFDFTRLREIVALPDVVAIPSRMDRGAEGQTPAKIFDAMSMAKPVVASRIADIAEILGDAGVTFPPGDVTALANALQLLTDDPERRRRLGAAARTRAVERYSYAANRQRLIDLVETLAPVALT